MDPKLYKTLKQLVKLGIINNNTRIRQVRRRRRKRKANSSSSVLGGYAQPTDHLRSNVVYSSPSATIQTEQAMVNLKASEMQLERALTNRNLPDEHREKVINTLEKIKTDYEKLKEDNEKSQTFALEQREANRNSYEYLHGLYKDIQYKTPDNYDNVNVEFYEDEPEIKKYNDFVPQTKNTSNPYMSPVMGIYRNVPDINSITKENDEENKELPDKNKPLDLPEDIPNNKTSYYRSKESMQKEYAELSGKDLEDVKTENWKKDKLFYEINRHKIINLQSQYRASGGIDERFFKNNYNDLGELKKEVNRLINPPKNSKKPKNK